MISIMQLPKTKLMTFNRDPLEFWMFMRSFDNSIGSVAIEYSAKLNRLLQYCKEEALKVIVQCCYESFGGICESKSAAERQVWR